MTLILVITWIIMPVVENRVKYVHSCSVSKVQISSGEGSLQVVTEVLLHLLLHVLSVLHLLHLLVLAQGALSSGNGGEVLGVVG